MKTGTISIFAAALLCSGCATVDLQSMATEGNRKAVADYETESNVVERAVQSLRNAFASRGFGAKTSEKKMQAAADMLLNGLSSTTVATETAYGDTPIDTALILEDIRMARSHVERTSRAAEIYLDVSPTRRDLRDELSLLETALLASDRASYMFQSALSEQVSGDAPSDLDLFDESVDRLRRVTNEFGARVRSSAQQTSEVES